MDEEFGMVPFIQHSKFLRGEELQASESKKFEIESRVRAIIDELYEETKRIVEVGRDKIEALSSALDHKETLNSSEIAAILG